MRSSEPLKIDDFINQALAHAYIETEDVYYNLNNFYYPKYGNARQDGNIFGINALGIDFDYYKIPQYKNLNADEFYNNILKDKLPFKPTYVVDSGRGIYLLYKIEKCPKAMLQYYKTVYKHFVKEFEAYGADPIATLATQVLRLHGTMNSKSNSLVEIIEANQTDYSITDFQTLLPYKYEKVKELKEELTTEKLEQPYKKPIKNAQLPAELLNGTVIVDKRFRRARNTKFMKLFIYDLKTLIKHRNKLGHNEGARAIIV
ncbi:hypothetical protein MAM33_01090 [Erysipelothrix rhusiopathiae]|uniref:hypothetical protein n=1 Tax=Erysipelothrix rhusiopathiae TaxID=1648 RepID=UPI001EDD3751|nr:hypothetical protein [Erysipelothrix rhusiopathiae]MCG4435914.1 hypothetical protein [Erysipelothrix rhusiopathiae]